MMYSILAERGGSAATVGYGVKESWREGDIDDADTW